MEDYYLREFRGYMNGEIVATFPLHWVDSIEMVGSVMQVNYNDDFEDKFILVDKIDVK